MKGGGHKMAGGFTVSEEKISTFRDFVIKNFEKNYKSTNNELNLYLDSRIAPSALNESFYKDINSLGPFGSGNREPKFVIENIKILSSDAIGLNHIKATLIGSDGYTFKAFAWNAKDTSLEKYLNKDFKSKINIAGQMRLNEWRGKKEVQFFIEDITLA